LDFSSILSFDGLVQQLAILIAGIGAGTVFGSFGAGGAAVAGPLLALIGLPAPVAVASPLPALLPASLAGARGHLRAGRLDARIAKLAIAGGLPGTILGGLASGTVGGHLRLVLSGLLLLVVGLRLVLPDAADRGPQRAARRERAEIVLLLSFAVGLLSGFLVNGGGFLLIPVFVLLLGLSTEEASGTSMLAVGFLSLPTLLLHWSLGHIDWSVSLLFALGVLPGSLVGARMMARFRADRARRTFGALLVGFAAWFLAR